MSAVKTMTTTRVTEHQATPAVEAGKRTHTITITCDGEVLVNTLAAAVCCELRRNSPVRGSVAMEVEVQYDHDLSLIHHMEDDELTGDRALNLFLTEAELAECDEVIA